MLGQPSVHGGGQFLVSCHWFHKNLDIHHVPSFRPLWVNREWRGPAFRVGLALLSASLAARATPAGALLFLLAPLALAREAVRLGTRVRWLGWARPRARTALLVGAAAGLFLGGHLLVTASMTLGYGVAVPSASLYLAALAYDAGANALSAAWLFSGAIFSLRWRSSSFWPAATTATAAALARYLLDPALPRAVEVAAGAVFYLTVLGLACCALRAWSGSVVPGYLSTVAFFAFYRTLHP